LVAWDVGVGLGILLGGVLSEHWGYSAAFWVAWIVNLAGFLGYWMYVKGHFTRERLR
jgi:predicted MFS family arabinose efflux permease